jgi:hypothetical protein
MLKVIKITFSEKRTYLSIAITQLLQISHIIDGSPMIHLQVFAMAFLEAKEFQT